MAGQPSVHHDGVSCDGCMLPNFTGNRYKCLRCYDFDLCHACYTVKRFNSAVHVGEGQPPHSDAHPVLCILSQRDFELLYEGDPTKSYETCRVVVFTCPYCGQTGFTHNSFFEHIQRDHHEPPPNVNVNCPLCIACPEFDANREVDNLFLHWTQTHSNFEPGSGGAFREASRSAARRPMLARRTTRQPAGNNQNPRRTTTTQRTLQRLYAEVLAENGASVNGGVGAAAAQISQFGLPWANDLVDVDDMFRMANLNRNLPPLPTGFPTAGDAARIAAAQLQPLASVSANLLPSLRVAASHRAASSSTNEYAAPSSSRGTSNRTATVPAVQVIRALGTSPVYPTIFDDVSEEDNTIGNLDYDLSEDDGSSLCGDEEEFESAEESAEGILEGTEEKGAVEVGVAESRNPQLLKRSSDAIQRHLSDSEFLWEEDVESNNGDEDFPPEYEVEEEFSSAPLGFSNGTTLLDIKHLPNPVKELRRVCTDSEWSQIVRFARDQSDGEAEEEERADTPRAALAGSVHDEARDLQCWLTVQLDTSQLAFANPTMYWKDTRFLRLRKMQREMSVVSDLERTLEQNEVAGALLRAAVPFQLAGRELDTTAQSVRSMMREVKFGDASENGVGNNEQEDVIMAASRRLESESGVVDGASTAVEGQKGTVATAVSDGTASSEDEEDVPEPVEEFSIL